MVRKSTSQLRDSRFLMAESALSAKVGQALRDALGSSRRATKTVMRWTNVSDTTARAWISGRVVPSGRHLLALAANCHEVMVVVLRMTGHSELEIGIELQEIEHSLLLALTQIRTITGTH
jgi:hypothetical protein